MNKAFSNFTWENEPSVNTPLNANNLNKVNRALNEIDNRVVSHDTTKANQTDMQNAITSVSLDENTGIFTFTKHNGTTFTIDTRLEKVVMNWNFDSATQTLYLILQDGTEMPVDLSAFITNVDFKDSTTIRSVLNDDGTVSFEIIDGTITGDKLEPNYLANVQLASTSAIQSAESAEASAVRAEEAAERAENVSDIKIATTDTAGIVKPDGTTITVDADGTIHSAGGSGGGITEEELNAALDERIQKLPEEQGGGFNIPGSLMILNNLGLICSDSGEGLIAMADGQFNPFLFLYLTLNGIRVEYPIQNVLAYVLDSHNFANYITPSAIGALSSEGGTITGELKQIVDTATVVRRKQKNSAREIQEYIGDNGVYMIADATNNKTIIYSTVDGTTTFNGTASGNLPLDGGGTVQKASALPMAIRNTSGNACYFQFAGASGNLGGLGFDSADSPVFLDKTSGVAKKLLHAGNKPSGTYTGTGTAKNIATGGIGDMLLLWSEEVDTTCLVMPTGALNIQNNEVNWLAKTSIYYENGTLYFSTGDDAFNKSGTTYKYRVI